MYDEWDEEDEDETCGCGYPLFFIGLLLGLVIGMILGNALAVH